MKTSQNQNLTLPAALFSVLALTIGLNASPAHADDAPTNSAVVDNVHCSGEEGFFLVSYSTTSTEPVSFVTHLDGVAPKEPIVVTADEPIGDSFGTTPGSHLIEVYADGVEIHEETIEVTCDELGPPPIVVDDNGLHGDVEVEAVEDGHTGVATLVNTGA